MSQGVGLASCLPKTAWPPTSLLLINNILGGGVSSLLFQKVREDHGLCYSIYSYLSSFNNTGIVTVYTGLNANCAPDALNLIRTEIEGFVKKGIDNVKLTKAKEQIKGNYILGLESTSSRMFTNGKSVLFLNRVNEPKDIMEKIDNIKQEDIARVMERTFKKGILNSAFVGENLDMDLYTDILSPSKFAFDEGAKYKV